MKLAHTVEISVFCKDAENLEQVRLGLIRLIPFDIQAERVKISETEAEGLTGNKIMILSVRLTNERQVRLFVENLLRLIGKEGIITLLSQLESRLDEDLFFFIRLSKPDWLDGRAILTDSGNCYHIKILIAAYPKNKQAGLRTLREYLEKEKTF